MFYTALFFAVLLLVSAIFSGTETAFTSVNEISLSSFKNKGNRRVKIAIELLRNKGSVIAAILVGNNIVNTVLAVYAGSLFNEIFVKTGMLSPSLGPIIASVITVIFLLIFGEVIPKHVGVTFSKAWTMAIVYPLWIVVTVLKPITFTMNLLSKALMSLLPKINEYDDAPTIQELMLLAKVSEKAGHIDSMERKLMLKSSSFNDLLACDVMIPRNCIDGLPAYADIHEVREAFKESMFSRVPVYGNDLDEIVGIFNYKELIKLETSDYSKFKLDHFMQPPLFVPENVEIGELLERMKTSRSHMAIVVDEFGSTAGIITLEDIVERLFGLIDDEYDVEVHVSNFFKHSNGDYEVPGSLPLHDLSTALSITIPEEARRQANTLNGFLTFLKGDFLKTKDKFSWGGLTFTVKKIDGLVAEKVLIRKKDSKTEGKKH